MDNLWAPWRIEYIKAWQKNNSGKCIFCSLIKDRKNDKKNLILTRTKYSLSILNKFPYANGHAMVAPLPHLANIEQLTKSGLLDLFDLLGKTKKILDKVLKPQGYNIGINLGKIAGAGIEEHLHIHIVPRWLGDTNFMPVIASTKVISQSLTSLYKSLKKNAKG